MKPSICVAVLVLCCAVGLLGAQEPAATAPAADAPAPEPAAAPRIEFESLEHDFGHAVSGAQLKTTFTFRNAGSSALLIHSVKAG